MNGDVEHTSRVSPYYLESLQSFSTSWKLLLYFSKQSFWKKVYECNKRIKPFKKHAIDKNQVGENSQIINGVGVESVKYFLPRS